MRQNRSAHPYIIGLAALCPIIFYIGDKGVIGQFVNRFAPCVQEPMNSFPCYGIYDIYIMMFAVGLGIMCSLILAINVYRPVRLRSKENSGS